MPVQQRKRRTHMHETARTHIHSEVRLILVLQVGGVSLHLPVGPLGQGNLALLSVLQNVGLHRVTCSIAYGQERKGVGPLGAFHAAQVMVALQLEIAGSLYSHIAGKV
eukprot:1158800-Pelagomonas_calceolata.AAC.5